MPTTEDFYKIRNQPDTVMENPCETLKPNENQVYNQTDQDYKEKDVNDFTREWQNK